MMLHGYFLSIQTPWKLIVDLDGETITESERNWYPIGVGIAIRATGGKTKVNMLAKRDVKLKEEMLMTNNSRMRCMVFH